MVFVVEINIEFLCFPNLKTNFFSSYMLTPHLKGCLYLLQDL